MKSGKADIIIFTFLAVFFSLLVFNNFKGEAIKRPLSSDAWGYYQYLPAFFIAEGDGDLPSGHHHIQNGEVVWEWKRSDLYTFSKLHYAIPLENGNKLNLFQYGVALLQAPFFLLSHALAHLGFFDADGYNSGYYWFILFAGIFYALAGIFLLKCTLEEIFSQITSWLTVLLVVFGSSALYYTVGEPGLSHIYSFFSASGLLYFTQKFYQISTRKRAFGIAFFLGLLIIIRSYNILFAFVPMLWTAGQRNWRGNMLKLIRDFKSWLLWIFVPFLLFLPQLFYWKHTTGRWIVFSYGEAGQGFEFYKDPYLFSVMFSIQNGFLTYAPVMVLAFIGLALGWMRPGSKWIMVLAVLLPLWYLISSWWAWWFGGAFGHRAFIDLLPLLAFPFAHFVELIRERSPRFGFAGLVLFALLAVYFTSALSVIYQSPWDGPSWTRERFFEQVMRILPF